MTQAEPQADARAALERLLLAVTDVRQDRDAVIVLARSVTYGQLVPMVDELRKWLGGSEFDFMTLERVLTFRNDWSNTLYRTCAAELLADAFVQAICFKPVKATLPPVAQGDQQYID